MLKYTFLLALALFGLGLSSLPAFAEMDNEGDDIPMMMDAPAKTPGPYDHAMKTMMEGMSAQKITGDADVDFVNGMIPHHQGAIDMAKTVLATGKDPAIKKLAEGIVKAQESEIKLMQDWLAAHAKDKGATKE